MSTLAAVRESYTDALLNGHTREAYDIIKEALNNPYSLIDVYTVIADAMYRIGDLWETNDISITGKTPI
jgi:methanogenic corrinoid protein MtbC1